MATLLSFILLIQFFTPVQEQSTSTQSPPVDVLELEVLARHYKARRVKDPRSNQPTGPVTAQSIPGVRPGTDGREHPTIADRSSELGTVGRPATPPAPIILNPRDIFIYEYRVRFKNTSPKKIKAILWEYQLIDSSATTVLSQRIFTCGASIKPGSEKVLEPGTYVPPSRVVDAETEGSQKQRVVVNRVEFSDGSIWTRAGWKHEGVTRTDLLTPGHKIKDGLCLML